MWGGSPDPRRAPWLGCRTGHPPHPPLSLYFASLNTRSPGTWNTDSCLIASRRPVVLGPNWRDLTLPRASPGYKRHSATALINCISCCIWLHLLHFIAFYSPFVLENRGLGVSPDRSVTRRPLIGIMTRCSVRCATCWRNSASQPKPSTSNFKFIPDSGTEHQRAASIC